MKQPTPQEITAARTRAGLTQKAAAALCSVPRVMSWSEWERGVYKMPMSTWELFLLKTGQRK